MSCIAGATADAAVDDHPGFVPDVYLDGLDARTAVMARGPEPRSAGVWERAAGGYRILDQEVGGRCEDLVRQLSRRGRRGPAPGPGPGPGPGKLRPRWPGRSW